MSQKHDKHEAFAALCFFIAPLLLVLAAALMLALMISQGVVA